MKKTTLLTLLATLSLTAAAFADDKPILTVYSYDSFTSDWGPGPKLKAAFEKACDCTVKFITFDDGVTMFNRLRLEGDKPKPDVIIVYSL